MSALFLFSSSRFSYTQNMPTAKSKSHSKSTKRVEPEDFWPEEWVDWFHLSPEERWDETARLWQTFLILGGNLDPEPDTQSPFHDPAAPGASIADGRSGLRVIRRGGI